VGGRQISYRDDVDRADGHGELIVANDDDDLGREGDEIPVRHNETASVGKAQGERHESVFNSFPDLVNHCGTQLRSTLMGKTPDCPLPSRRPPPTNLLKSHRALITFRTRMNDSPTAPGHAWLAFTLLTVISWGVYGILLHKGQVLMGDPANGRYKAFLFVGIAYFLTAVLAPLFLLMAKGSAFSGYTAGGSWWSLIAGIAGAIGAFGVLLAFGAKGKPPEVMAIVFAGAPVINAVVALILTRHELDWGKINPLFYVGMALALAGGGLVTLYKPTPPPAKAKPTAVQQAGVTSPAKP
jgi:hypothetical protein